MAPWLEVDHAAQTNAEERERIVAAGGILRQHGNSGTAVVGTGGAWRVGEMGLAAG